MDLSDAVYLLSFLFLGGSAPKCQDACDSDDNEALEITDPIYVLNYLFLGGPKMREPFPLEDPDPEGDKLTCLNGKYPPTDFRVIPPEVFLHRAGTTLVLAVLVREESGDLADVRLSQSTRYSSSAPEVATVSPEGIVTAVSPGDATVTVRYRGAARTSLIRVLPGATGAPVVSITAPSSGSVVTSPTVQISGLVTDPLAALRLGEEPLENSGGFFRSTANLAQGPNHLEVVATGAGGEGRASITVTRAEPGSSEAVGPDGAPLPSPIVLEPSPPDETPPAVAIASPAPESVLSSGIVDVAGTVDDPDAAVFVNGVLAEKQGGKFSARLRLPPGANILRAQAVDLVGNRSSAEVAVTVNTVFPSIQITEPAGFFAGVTAADPVQVRGTVAPPEALVFVGGIQAQASGGTWSAELSLPPGIHDLTATAVLSGTPPLAAQAVQALVVDREGPWVEVVHPPESALLSAAGHRVEEAAVAFAGRVADPGVPRHLEGPISLSIAGVAAAVSGGTFSVQVPVAAGENILRLVAADARGNTTSRDLKVVRGGPAAPTLVVIAGQGQTLKAGQAELVDLAIEALTASGQPDGNVSLEFKVAVGDGTLAGGARSLRVSTGADGKVALKYQAGGEAGAGSQVVTAKSLSRADSPVAWAFNVDFADSRLLAARGKRRYRGVAGRELADPVEVRLLDGLRNPVGGTQVLFRVIEGSAKVGGGMLATATTDRAGIASARVDLPAGSDSVSRVEAAAAGAEPVIFVIEGLRPLAAADTCIEGRVLDERGGAFVGAVVRVSAGDRSIEVHTGPDGGFRLKGVPVGNVLVTASLDVPTPEVLGGWTWQDSVSVRATVLPGRANQLDFPMRLLRFPEDPIHARRFRLESFESARALRLSLPELPGLDVAVLAGAPVLPAGATARKLALAAPNLSIFPVSSSDDIHVDVPLAILPAGVRFEPAARVSAPNVREKPGAAVSLYAYRGSAGGFLELALGVVGDDGARVSLAGAPGLEESGWFFFSKPGPQGGRTGSLSGRVTFVQPGLNEVPQRAGSHVLGFNVYAHSGEFFLEATDLALPAPGRGLSYSFRRRYESRHNFQGSLGWNWEHEYEDRRIEPGLGGGNVIRATGMGAWDEYLWDAEAGRFVSPVGVFSRLFKDSEGFFIERQPDGTRYRYHPLDASASAGRLESVADRTGTKLSFSRDARGLISEARDALARVVAYFHDGEGRIESIMDFTGRRVSFGYDAAGDLVSVTSPAVVENPTGNNFPDGVRTEYLYSSGFSDGRLDHNLLAVIAPREAASTKVPTVTVAYEEDAAKPTVDRVVSQSWDGTILFEYESFRAAAAAPESVEEIESFLVSAAGKTRITDQQGRISEVIWSGAGLPLGLTIFTRQGVWPRSASSLHPPPGTVPPHYETRWSWTREGLLESKVEPRGERTLWFYDEDNPIRLAQAALIRLERHPIPGSQGQGALAPAVTSFRRDPLFGVVVGETSPSGAARTCFLDYQEGTEVSVLAAEAGVDDEELTEALARAGIKLGLGDINEDGRLTLKAGLVVKEVPPSATLPDGTVDESFVLSAYSRFGQLYWRRDETGRVTYHEYHPESDPDGDGIANPAPGLDTTTGGFLARKILDLGGGSTAVLESYQYDPRGYLAKVTGARGDERFYVHNALGWLAEVRLAPPLKYRWHFLHDPSGNRVRLRTENYTSTDGGGHFLVSDNRWIDVDIEYDLLGRPTAVTREVSEGEVGPARSIRTEYVYHPGGALARAIHPVAGTNEAWEYDERDLEVLHVIAEGTNDETSTSTFRDENGNVVLRRDAGDTDGDGEAEIEERRYDAHGRLAAVIDAAGGARIFEHDLDGRVVSEAVLGSPGGPTPRGRGGEGNVLLSRMSWRHDERGRCFEKSRSLFGGDRPPSVLQETFYHDGAGRLVRKIDSAGEWVWTHDAAGRVETERAPDGTLRTFRWDLAGNLIRETAERLTPEPVEGGVPGDPDYDSEGRYREVDSIVRAFDFLDRLTVLVDPAGGVWRVRYDSRGNKILVSDAVGTPINAENDPELVPLLDLLSPWQRQNANDHGNRRYYVYDNLSRLVEARHELRTGGTGGGEIDVMAPYNVDGTILEKFEWDDNGRLRAWTDDVGSRTEVAWSGASCLTRKTWADGSFETYERDRDGNLKVLTDAEGSIIRQNFDALNRVVERTVERAAGVEGTTLQRFEHDGLSRLTLAFDDNDPDDSTDDAWVVLRRDSLGNVVEEVADGFSAAASLDLLGRPVSLRYPAGSRTDTPRDITGGLSKLSSAFGVHATYRHFGSGRLLERRLACGVVLSFLRPDFEGIPRNTAYDAAGDVLEQVYRNPAGEVVRGSEYGRDRAGFRLYDRPLDGTLKGKGEVWRYDSAYRIFRFLPNVIDPRVPPQDPLEKLVFYHDGNHSWRFIEADFSQRRLTVNPRGGYVTSDEDTFTYDRNGSLEGSGMLVFFYDALRRLKRVERSGSVVGIYRHDARGCEDPERFLGKGRRIAKDVRLPGRDQPPGFKRLVYWGDLVIEERDADARLIRQYLYEDGGRAAVMIRNFESSPSRVYDLLHDEAGSITAVLDDAGDLKEIVKYGVHGEPRIFKPGDIPAYHSLVDNSLAFGGLYHDDELGFHMFGSRPFDPSLGRYLTDVSPLLPEAPLQLNGYLLPGLPGLGGEIPGAGSSRRRARYLAPLRVELSGAPRGGDPRNLDFLPALLAPRLTMADLAGPRAGFAAANSNPATRPGGRAPGP